MNPIIVKDNFIFHQSYQPLDSESQYQLNERNRQTSEIRLKMSIQIEKNKREMSFGFIVLTKCRKMLQFFYIGSSSII
jgi:hypothetical protein